MIDSLNVVEMMSGVSDQHATGNFCATELASALLGEYGSKVNIVLERDGKVISCAVHRAPLPRGCQWIRAPLE